MDNAALIQRQPWTLFVTLTTKEAIGHRAWLKRYRLLTYIVQHDPAGLDLGLRPLWKDSERLRQVVAYEPQKRGAIHAHALWAAPDLPRVRRRWIANQWNRLCTPRTALVEEVAHGQSWLVTPDSDKRGVRIYEIQGMAKVVPVSSQDAVAMYCAKYVSKGGIVKAEGL
tara:strand:+ start:932 stop:1438 length:507 start_codon:yes stop_codon:yes gene_type:complete